MKRRDVTVTPDLDETRRRALVSAVMTRRAQGRSYAALFESLGGDVDHVLAELPEHEAALEAAMGIPIDSVTYADWYRWAETGRRPQVRRR